MNILYKTEKPKTATFLKELALQLDYGTKQKILLHGDFNTNYFNLNERNKIDTILVPYGISIVNKRLTGWRDLIDFIIKDDELTHSQVFSFESPITSDHKAIARITNIIIRSGLKEDKFFLIIQNAVKIYTRPETN